MMRLKFSILFFFLSFSLCVHAGGKDSINVCLTVMDKVSKVQLPQIFVEVMTTDSVVIFKDSTSVGYEMRWYNYSDYEEPGYVYGKLPTWGTYLVRLSGEGYETTVLPLVVPERYRKKRVQGWSEDFYLSRKKGLRENLLHTATVTATKIKMVNRGDTVVFNADAFELSEGSMLDALLAQLPGMKLTDGGVITYNGQQIETLLVDGKDFFREDPKVALENLPAYMVNKVEVYRKEKEEGYLMSEAEREATKRLVVDVRLKKQYAQGWVGNAELAGGTSHRYLARLFALRYTDHSRLSIFGTMNNLNDTKSPGREGEWGGGWDPAGTVNLKMAGINFNWDDKNSKAKLSSYAEITDEGFYEEEKTSAVTYLIGGDTWSRLHRQKDTRRNHFQWNNRLELPQKDYYLSVEWKTDFMKDVANLFSRRAVFDTDPVAIGLSSPLDSVFVRPANSLMRRWLISKMGSGELMKTYKYIHFINTYFSWQEPWLGNRLWLYYHHKYINERTHHYQQYDVERAKAQVDEFQHRYTNTPEKWWEQKGGVGYNVSFGDNWNIKLDYNFFQAYHRGNRLLHRLDSLPGWGRTGERLLTALPSTTDSLHQAIDIRNSYLTGKWEKNHEGTLGFVYKKKAWIVNFHLDLTNTKHRVKDYRNEQHKEVSKHLTTLSPYLHIRYRKSDVEGGSFQYDYDRSLPAITQFLPTLDTSDPFVVQVGNPNLKPTKQHNWQLNWWKFNAAKGLSAYSYMLYYIRGNAIAQGRVYDRTTGVTTYRPQNMNGNWDFHSGFSCSKSLDSLQRWTLNGAVRFSVGNSVDLVPDGTGSSRSSVRTWNNQYELGLTYRKKGVSVTADGELSWKNLLSRRTDFVATHALEFSYGIRGNIDLPWKMELSTDLKMYARRGYSEPTMNDNNLIWNMSLSRSFFKGKQLRLSLEGYDMLGQRKTIRRDINEQGYSETWYNAIPRYFLLRLAWNFNKTPKKAHH